MIFSLCAMVFFAGFVDAAAGGGGLISLPAGLCSAAGHCIGAGYAIKKGAAFIRPVMILVMTLLFGKILFDVFLK